MEAGLFEQMHAGGESFLLLQKNAPSARKVIHLLLNGKHIDPHLGEEFRFLEDHAAVWESFFELMGYRLRRSELGGGLFFFLEAAAESAPQSRLSRGATFLGLYLAWHFFMQGPGEPERMMGEELYERLVTSYPYPLLRSVFVRRTGPSGSVELSEDQAEKLRGHLRRELAELAKYRFIDLKPNARAHWDDLTLCRLPGLYRFWELALHVQGRNSSMQETDLDGVIRRVWGSLDPDAEEDGS